MMNVMHCLDKGSERTEHHIHHHCCRGHDEPGCGREDIDAVVTDDEFRDLMAGVVAPVTVVTTAARTAARRHGQLVRLPVAASAAGQRGVRPRLQRCWARSRRPAGSASTSSATPRTSSLTFARRGVDRFAAVPWFTRPGAAPPGRRVRLDGLRAGPQHRSGRPPAAVRAGHRGSSRRDDTAPLVYAHRTFGTHSRFAERPRPGRSPTSSPRAALSERPMPSPQGRPTHDR